MMTPFSFSIRILRSGLARSTACTMDAMTQTENPNPDRPKLRVCKRKCTDAIKSACAMVSAKCGVSAEMSRKIVQIVAKELYEHDFYLSAKEQHLNELLVCDTDKETVSQEAEKVQEEEDKPAEKETETQEAEKAQEEEDKPKDYTFVIASARTISDHKQMMATQNETEAAVMLLNKSDFHKATVHFDTTSRSNIDGDWPTIILRFSNNTNNTEFRLRPIFFAYKDREQIINLFIETFNRLADAVSISETKTITPAMLWENVDAIMTDAVTKNLKIEDLIPERLGSTHHPHHLLCKSHTVEAFDRSSLKVLSRVEKNVSQQETMEGINPALKSFFRSKAAIVEAGIDAIISLITHNKSANSCSQADLFDYICEREGVSKRVFLYQQRRFAKVGKAAACILEAKDTLNMLLDEVQVTNLLVESCKIYMASELFITELECLAYFNHHVTFPYLNCVEVSSQEELLKIMPQLYKDLLMNKVDTLNKFVVKISGISTPTLTSETAEMVVKEMCQDAAEVLKLQCGKEYGFSSDPQRATDISKLNSQQLEGLPSNNCISERDLSRFDREAKVSKCRNRKFRAINIRNNMMLYKSNKAMKIDKITKHITGVLAERERKWSKDQAIKMKARIEEKLLKAANQKDYTKKLLRECKSWKGPADSGMHSFLLNLLVSSVRICLFSLLCIMISETIHI